MVSLVVVKGVVRFLTLWLEPPLLVDECLLDVVGNHHIQPVDSSFHLLNHLLMCVWFIPMSGVTREGVED